MNSKVTVLLATYNRAHLIEETLLSIQNQTHSNFECLVTDDNSTDNTSKIVQSFCKEDERFHYFKKPSHYLKGLPDNRNFGLDLASKNKAEYIQFFDDDDIMHPEKLEKQLKVFYNSPNTEIVNCKYQGFVGKFDLVKHKNRGDMKINSENLAEDFLLRKVRINSLGPIFKASLLENIRYDNEFNYYAEEEEFYLRLFFEKKPIYNIVDEFLFYYRHHPISITASKNNKIQKLGTNIRLRQKVWDYLYDKNLLNKRTTEYFFRYFLLNYFDKEYVNNVYSFIIESPNFDNLQKFKFRFIIVFNRFYRKFIYKILR